MNAYCLILELSQVLSQKQVGAFQRWKIKSFKWKQLKAELSYFRLSYVPQHTEAQQLIERAGPQPSKDFSCWSKKKQQKVNKPLKVYFIF